MAASRTFFILPTRTISFQSAQKTISIHLFPRRAQHTTSSTSALAYKAVHRRINPLPTQDPRPSWSAPAAVSSILYETPLPSQLPPKRHILNCLVQNEPGVLSRVSGILAARGFNIDSLVVCNTEVDDLSRMTIVLSGQDGVVEQARRQLEDLVPVWAVLDYTAAPLVQRELLLAKISILGPEYFEDLMDHHREISGADVSKLEASKSTQREEGQAQNQQHQQNQDDDYHPSRLAASQALRHKHEHLEAITHLTHQFGGKVLDISTNNCIVEIAYSSAKPPRIDAFMKLISPFGILESARTGLMALPRTPLHAATEELEKDAGDLVDASSLPPG
ncbi:acetolactate synthase, regulatory subunit [Lecanora helva]